MGATAENLHDRYPQLTKERADAYAVASQHKYAKALAEGRIQGDLVDGRRPQRRAGWGLATADEQPRPGQHRRGPGRAAHAVPAARPGHRRQRRRR